MDHLLRQHARLERDRGGACRPSWRILLESRRDPDALHDWWRAHGASCGFCGAHAQRAANDDPNVAAALRLLRVVRLPGRPDAGLGWAAATETRLDDSRSPLPRVCFRRLASDLGTKLDAVWCVSCDDQLLLILCGDEAPLAQWRNGARVQREEDGSAAEFVLAGDETARAFCPNGTFDGDHALCLVCREPLATLAETPLLVPGLLQGRFQLELVSDESAPAGTGVADLVRRNRLSTFLTSLDENAPGNEQRATCEFYLRLLARQGRIPAAERVRLAALPWLSREIRTRLGHQP